MSKTVIFDIGGVYFSDGTQIAIGSIASRYKIKPELLKPARDLGMEVIAFKNSSQLEDELMALSLLPDGH